MLGASSSRRALAVSCRLFVQPHIGSVVPPTASKKLLFCDLRQTELFSAI